MDAGYLKRRYNNPISRFRVLVRSRAILGAIRPRMEGLASARVLDIGACDGKMLSYLKDKLPGLDCVGVEPLEEFARNAVDGRIRVIKAEAGKLPFEDGSFDFAFMASVLEHIEDAAGALRETKRVLKKGGLFTLISVAPAYERLNVLAGIKKNDHFRNYTRGEIKEILRLNGFKIFSSRPLFLGLGYNLTVAERDE